MNKPADRDETDPPLEGETELQNVRLDGMAGSEGTDGGTSGGGAERRPADRGGAAVAGEGAGAGGGSRGVGGEGTAAGGESAAVGDDSHGVGAGSETPASGESAAAHGESPAVGGEGAAAADDVRPASLVESAGVAAQSDSVEVGSSATGEAGDSARQPQVDEPDEPDDTGWSDADTSVQATARSARPHESVSALLPPLPSAPPKAPRPKPADSDTLPSDAGQAEPGQAEPGQAEPGQAESGQAESGQAESGQAEPGAADQEASDAAEPAAKPPAGTPSRLRALTSPRAGVLIGLLCGLLGFGIAVQVRSNTSTSGLNSARQEDLVRILDDLSSREERLRLQIASLEAARTRLTTTGDKSTAALSEARARSTALGILAGTVAAQGPGVTLTVTDPQRGLSAEDLLDAVEELRAAGAEAIQVGPVRIGLDSAFTERDGTILADGTALTAPYVVQAIGDPPTLATALQIPGGVTDTVHQAGGEARIVQRNKLIIRALRSLSAPQYAQPAGGR
jgi:uncharacterized protein YlxW (UPF0749 family)